MSKRVRVGSLAKSSPFAPTKRASIAPSADVSIAEASGSENRQNVAVCVRMRPSRSDRTEKEAVWSCDRLKNQIVPTDIHPAIAKRTTSSERAGASLPTLNSSHDLDQDDALSTYNFQFDKLVCEGEDTNDMYISHISPVVKAAVEGYNGTVFAYGQTGSGKTHTMSGSKTEPGVIPRAVQQIFSMIANESEREFLLRVSYLEIYNETLKDLLAPLPPTTSASLQTTDRPASPVKGGGQPSVLRIVEDQKQNRVVITGLREEIVTDAHTVLDLIHRGQEERHVGATDWNERSSRSHCVFQLTVESRSKATEAAGGKEVRVSQLNLIDLAGSERAASQAERRKEGAFINKSLLTLGTVIGKLTEPSDSGDAHIPYRDSKLTRILQTSLAGNARIAVICTLSPDMEHANETLSTLKFGKRCKLVVTTAKKGVNMDDKALLQKYRKELDALRARLDANTSFTPPPVSDLAEESELTLQSQHRLDELKQQAELAEEHVTDMQRQRNELRSQIDHLTRLIITSHSVARENDPSTAAEALQSAGAPGTPVRKRTAHTTALTRRGPRMSDFPALFITPSNESPAESLSGAKPFELEAELAALRRQLRQQLELQKTLQATHQAELERQNLAHAQLTETVRLNKEALEKADLVKHSLTQERDEARQTADQAHKDAVEERNRLTQEQETQHKLHLEALAEAKERAEALQTQIDVIRAELVAKESEAVASKAELHLELEKITSTFESQLVDAKQAHQLESNRKLKVESQLSDAQKLYRETAAELERTKAALASSTDKAVLGAAESAALLLEQQNLAAKVRVLQTELDSANQAIKAAEQASSTRITELQAKIKSLDDALAQSSIERDLLVSDSSKLRETLSTKEQQTTALCADLARAEAQVVDLEKAVLTERGHAETATKALNDSEHTSSSKLGQLQLKIESLDKDLSSSTQKRESLQAELLALRALTAEHEQASVVLHATLSQETAKVAELEQQMQTERASKQTAMELLDVADKKSLAQIKELHTTVQSLEAALDQSKQDKNLLEAEMATLKMSTSAHKQDSSALRTSLAAAEAKVADLEKQVLAAKAADGASATMKAYAVSRLRESIAVNSVPSSPSDVTKGHTRTGSVREYRRYQPRSDSADALGSLPESLSHAAALETRSVLLGDRATYEANRSIVAFGGGSKAEKEEIERLNAVINSQRAIMADLEKSVASWKMQMHAQAQLIDQLVQTNNNTVAAHSPPASDEEQGGRITKGTALGELNGNRPSPSVQRRGLFDTAKIAAAGDDHFSRTTGSLPRTTHLNLSTNPKMEPYYGAHSYNRPPPSTGSPLKKLDYSSNTWSHTSTKMSPLPLPSSATGSPAQSPSKRKPRKTIELDLELLKASPRVETNIKNKFCFDSPHTVSLDTPTKRRTNNASNYI